VSPGIAQGRVCIVRSLDDADKIQRGDVVIAPYTDVCWTIYFPLLSALVTELGGLLAHGAVCAREYGIPCIVNLPGVCDAFRTGDIVCVDGSQGVITLVTKGESKEM
jgi:rifampicin phosphotransferase